VRTLAVTLLLFNITLPALEADLDRVKAEPNLEKRSRLALENAHAALKGAKNAYANGETDKLKAQILEVQQSVELTGESLKETGKNPRRSPKYFKKAEIDTRDLLRRIEAFQDDMSVTDRPLLDPLRIAVQQVHDDLLRGIMEGKRK
jgi:hypothetical protein